MLLACLLAFLLLVGGGLWFLLGDSREQAVQRYFHALGNSAWPDMGDVVSELPPAPEQVAARSASDQHFEVESMQTHGARVTVTYTATPGGRHTVDLLTTGSPLHYKVTDGTARLTVRSTMATTRLGPVRAVSSGEAVTVWPGTKELAFDVARGLDPINFDRQGYGPVEVVPGEEKVVQVSAVFNERGRRRVQEIVDSTLKTCEDDHNWASSCPEPLLRDDPRGRWDLLDPPGPERVSVAAGQPLERTCGVVQTSMRLVPRGSGGAAGPSQPQTFTGCVDASVSLANAKIAWS